MEILIDYIIRLWEFISKKGNIFYFHQKKIAKKRNFNGLYKWTMEKYFQKKKLSRFFTEIKLLKRGLDLGLGQV